MILDRILEQRMVTGGPTPAGTLANPIPELTQALTDGAFTAAGVSINERTAEGIPAVYATVRVIAETVGQVPLKIYRKSDPNKYPDPTHPLYPLVHDEANPETTAQEFRENMTGHAALWGNAYAEIERRKSGAVKALWPLHPGCMTVDRGPDNRLRYTYRPPDGPTKVYHWDPLATPIFHLRYNGGRSPIRMLRESLATSKALEVFAATLFGNGARPGGVIQSKDPIKITKPQIEELRRQWNELHRGAGNAHKIAVLPPGLQWQAVGMPLEDAQFAELLNLQIEQAARIWRVPLFMIQSMEKTSTWGTGIEQMAIGFVNFTMAPWFTRWQQTIARDLLTYKSFETHEALFVLFALMRGDFKSLNDALQVQRQNGIINADEWRELVDMNEQADGRGQVYWRPSNFVPADTPVADPNPAPPAPVDEGARAAIAALEQRIADLVAARQPIEVHTPPVTVTVAEGAIRSDYHAAPTTVEAPVTIGDGAVHVDVDARTSVEAPSAIGTRKRVTKRDAHGRPDEVEETPITTAATE